MIELKKQQHYVWKEYLKPWTIDGKIYCKRDNKIFLSSLKNVAQKRFFYQSLKLGPEEIRFLQKIMRNVIPNVGKSMESVFKLYDLVSNSKEEYLIKCGIEDLHTTIENYGKTSLLELQKGNVDFFINDKNKHQLSLFLGVQYTRTNKMRKGLNPSELKNNKIDLDKLGVIMPFYIGEIIGKWIYDVGEIKVIENKTQMEFLTSDQPVFNIKAPLKRTDELKDFELYYPVTPHLAIYISKSDKVESIENNSDVDYFNQMVKMHSFEQVFARKKSDLI